MGVQFASDVTMNAREKRNSVMLSRARRQRNTFALQQADAAVGKLQRKKPWQGLGTLIPQTFFSANDTHKHCVHSSQELDVVLLLGLERQAKLLTIGNHIVSAVGFPISHIISQETYSLTIPSRTCSEFVCPLHH